MHYFIIHALAFPHLFHNKLKPLIQDSASITLKRKTKSHLSFEQFLEDYFLQPKIEYLSSEQLQRVLTVQMLIDMQNITNYLQQDQIVPNMSSYKILYSKYQTIHPLLQLWFLWAQLKQKQIKQKPQHDLLRFYEQKIMPQLRQFKNTLIKLKFEIYYSYQLLLVNQDQKAVQQLITLKHEFYSTYNLKSFIADYQLMKFDSSQVLLPNTILDQLKYIGQMPVEDFLQLIYLQIKLLYPISKNVAPALAESIFNEIQILTLASQQIHKQNIQIPKKYTQLFELMNKYYEKIGISIFKRRLFKFGEKPTHKYTKSLVNLTQDTLLPQSKKDNYHASMQSLYDPLMMQQIQFDLTKTKPSTSSSQHTTKKNSLHSRGASTLTRHISQFQFPDLHKDLVLEVGNYQIKMMQKKKPQPKISVAQIYQKLISSVPQTKHQSIIEDLNPQDLMALEQQQPMITIEQKKIPITYQGISRWKFIHVLMALNMKSYHLDLAGGSKRLPKLIAKHFLDILVYVDDPPFVPPTARTTKFQQIMRRNHKRTDSTKMANFVVKPRIGLKNRLGKFTANFSDKTRQTINKIKSLINMGVFKQKRKNLEKQSTILGALAPKKHTLYNYTDQGNRLKTTPEVGKYTQDEKQFQSLPTPRKEYEKKPQGNFGFFKTLMVAKRLSVTMLNQNDVNYLQEKYGTLQQVRQHHLYYPSIKYLICNQGIIEIWKLKYRDLTHDKNFMVICAQSEGVERSFYRFDLPVVKLGKEKKGITIWPTVKEALEEFEQTNKFGKKFEFNLMDSIALRHSFIVGLTQRARAKVEKEDIHSAGFVQSYFYNFHQSQIVKTKKIRGYSYDILPIIKTEPEQFVDLHLINREVNINMYNQKQQQLKLYKPEYQYQALEPDYLLLNNILLFRFMCASRNFMINGAPELNLKDICIRINSSVIRIKNDNYSNDFLVNHGKHVLLTLELKIERDLIFHIGQLLTTPINKQKQTTQIYGNEIDKRYFSFQVSSLSFNKETKGEFKKIELKPIQFPVLLYHQMLGLLNEKLLSQDLKNYFTNQQNNHLFHSLRFESLINQILYQQQLKQPEKEALCKMMNEFFEINLKESKIILKNDYDYLKKRKMSIQFISQKPSTSQLYAISPIEQKFIKKMNVINQKDFQLQNMFKLEQTQTIQQYEEYYHGKQTIEEPDFMNNNQEQNTAFQQIKQIPLYPTTKNNFSKQVNSFLQPFKQQKVFTRQSYYVNCQMPSSIVLKTMILNKSPELVKYFNCNQYQFMFIKKTSYRVQVCLYYTFNRKLEQQQAVHTYNERLYYFDGELLFMNVQIDNLQSKTQQIRMIFSFSDLQDLFRMQIPQHNNFYYFDDKFIINLTEVILNNTYAERRFMCVLPTFLNRLFMSHKHNRMKFVNYTKSISIQSDSPLSPRGNYVQVNDLNLLERHNNCKFVVLFYDVKEQVSKYYCETYLKEARVIGHYVKKFNIKMESNHLISLRQGGTEYAVITVYSHLILDLWNIQIYIPKTSRYLLGSINLLDLVELESNQILGKYLGDYKLTKKGQYHRQATQNKIILGRQKLYLNLTKFFFFTREISNNQNKKLVTQFIFDKKNDSKIKTEQLIWQEIIEILKLSKKAPYDVRIESEAQNKTYIEKNLIEQLEHDTGANSRLYKIIGENILQRAKNNSVENQEMLLHFKKLSQLYLNFIKENQIIMIRSTYQNSSQLCMNLGFLGSLKEFIHKMQLKIDKVGLYSIQFFLDFSEEEIHKDNPFLAFESINYANSSSFNLTIRIFGFQSDFPIYYANKSVNLREVLNLFIADGYFKYQTNYMNAKLSLSDLKQICEYVGFKIRTSNFLGLASPQRYLNSHPIFLEDKQSNQESDGLTYSQYKKKRFIQIQLFLAHAKVHINTIQLSNAQFTQEKLYFNQIDEICPYFQYMVHVGMNYQALQRLMQII